MAYARTRVSSPPVVPLKEQWLEVGSKAYDLLTIGGALVLMLGALYLGLLYAPTEKTQGDAQRIMYMHVPVAWIAYLAFGLVALTSLLYLWKKDRRLDLYAHSLAEVGVIFCTLVLLTGPVWARPIWGVWWTWDIRLTLTLLLWFIYVGYLMIRAQDLEPGRKARYAAVLGILGALSIPLNHFSVLLWRTMHPQPVVITEKGFGAGLEHPAFLIALMVSFLAFAALFAAVLRQRISLGFMQEELTRLQHRVAERQ